MPWALVAREQAIVPRAGSHNASHHCLYSERFHPSPPHPTPTPTPPCPPSRAPSLCYGCKQDVDDNNTNGSDGAAVSDVRPVRKQNTWLGRSKSVRCLFLFRRGSVVLTNERHGSFVSVFNCQHAPAHLTAVKKRCRVPHTLPGLE